jgi:hypothetical protein
VPDIIDIQPGSNVFLRGIEYGLIIIKYTNGEGAVQENEFYCMSHNRDRIVEMLRTVYLRKSESEHDRRRKTTPWAS